MTRTIHRFGSAEAVAAAALRLFAAEARAALRARHRAVVLLSGGSTPKAMYRLATTADDATRATLRACDYFMGDERTVPLASAGSNSGEAIRGLLDPLGVPDAQRYLPDGAAERDGEAARLTELLRTAVPRRLDGAPQFDIAFLGLGDDGHTASLFPGSSALAATGARYVATHVPRLDTWRLTVTFEVLDAARLVLLLATGAAKAPIMADLLAGRGDHPFGRVRAERMVWLLDTAAASAVPESQITQWSDPQ
jgi:6-phosphogluconolactonase